MKHHVSQKQNWLSYHHDKIEIKYSVKGREGSNLPCCRILCDRGGYNVVWANLKSVSARFSVSDTFSGDSLL